MANMSAAVPLLTLLPALTNKVTPTADSQPSSNSNAVSNVLPNPTAKNRENLRLFKPKDKLAKTQETSQVLVDHVNSLKTQLASCYKTLSRCEDCQPQLAAQGGK